MTDELTDLSAPEIVTVSRRIDAPAATIFALLRDPRRHEEIDGTGMLRGSDAGTINGVGDTFVMRMNHDEFGDYEMRNHVVEFIEDRAIAWAPKRHDVDDEDWDHRWGWRLEPDGAATLVTEYYDLTRSPDDARRILRNGERWRSDMEASLDRLAQVVSD